MSSNKSQLQIERDQNNRMKAARKLLSEAVEADEAADFNTAKDLYIAAIDMLVQVRKIETKPAVKRKLLMRIDELFLRAEALKDKLEYLQNHPEEEENEKKIVLSKVAEAKKKDAEAKQRAEEARRKAQEEAEAKQRSLDAAMNKMKVKDNTQYNSKLKRQGRPAVGLANLGQTCYLNSVLQCLASTEPLIHAIVAKCARENKLLPFLDTFMNTMQQLYQAKDSSYVFPDELFQAVGNVQATYRGNEQQDAMDVFQLLISQLHTTLNTAKPSAPPLSNNQPSSADMLWQQAKLADQSIVNDLFDYQLQMSINCSNCKDIVSTRYEIGRYVIVLPLTQEAFQNRKVNAEWNNLKLDVCLKKFFSTNDPLPDYRCPKCNKKNCCESSTLLLRPPQLLVLQIKRRGLDGRTKVRIEVPIDLDMSLYRVPNQGTQATSYELYGVINHNEVEASVKTQRPNGAPTPAASTKVTQSVEKKVIGGHYTAFAKAGVPGNDWYWFNDSKVVKIPQSKIKEYICTGSALVVGMFYQLV